jgi:spoIIIJ-associated protein
MEKTTNEEELESRVKEEVESLIAKMNFVSEVEVKKVVEEDGETLICNIKTKDSNYLIGQYGVNLQALQHIARVIVRKKTENRGNFILDVNSYRQEKNETVSALAKSVAQKAILEKKAVTMRPMSPYERRLVHLELSKNEQIKTESVGEGEDRRVVVKPANLS